MVMSVYVTPAAASQGNDKGKRDTAKQDIYYLDAKVKVVDGQPALKVETDKGYTSYEFPWPEVALVDGREEALKRQGSYYLLPTEGGYKKVHIEDFDVAFVAGQITLIAEVNPLLKVTPAAAMGALVKAGIPVTWANMKAAAILIKAGRPVTLICTLLWRGSPKKCREQGQTRLFRDLHVQEVRGARDWLFNRGEGWGSRCLLNQMPHTPKTAR